MAAPAAIPNGVGKSVPPMAAPVMVLDTVEDAILPAVSPLLLPKYAPVNDPNVLAVRDTPPVKIRVFSLLDRIAPASPAVDI